MLATLSLILVGLVALEHVYFLYAVDSVCARRTGAPRLACRAPQVTVGPALSYRKVTRVC